MTVTCQSVSFQVSQAGAKRHTSKGTVESFGPIGMLNPFSCQGSLFWRYVMFSQFEEIQKIGKTNVEAAVKNLGATTKNVQTLATETADYSKKAFQDQSALVEKLVAAKSLDKVFEIQTAYSKSAYDGFVSYATKVGEIVGTITKDAVKPYEVALTKATGK
jgi:hypothetical protein